MTINDFRSWMHSGDPAHGGAPYPVLTRCPVCGEGLQIIRLQCEGCGSALEGNFSLGRLQRLTREQLQFLEVFIKCRGKIKDVEEEIGVSYPTVVSRLNDLVQAMGFEVRQAQEETDRATRRQQVLEDLAAGRINAVEAAGRLRGR
ncbi:MAG: DUF2089 domain-containing protein [Dehalococcoidia bacterium]